MTQGFYKKIDDQIMHAPNYVESLGFVLVKEEKDNYEYPIDGWIWFDSEEEAFEQLNE